MTSASTLLVLLCIFILGGDAIRSFTFAMIFGVVIGTLATIFVASPWPISPTVAAAARPDAGNDR